MSEDDSLDKDSLVVLVEELTGTVEGLRAELTTVRDGCNFNMRQAEDCSAELTAAKEDLDILREECETWRASAEAKRKMLQEQSQTMRRWKNALEQYASKDNWNCERWCLACAGNHEHHDRSIWVGPDQGYSLARKALEVSDE